MIARVLALSIVLGTCSMLSYHPAFAQVLEQRAPSRTEQSDQYWLDRHAGLVQSLLAGALVALTFLYVCSTRRLATIADTQNNLTKSIQRAYISAEVGGLHALWGRIEGDRTVIGHVIFRNGGHLPARDFRWCAFAAFDANGLKDDFALPNDTDLEGTTIIAPGSHMKFGTRQIEVPTEPIGWIYVWGSYTYNDGFETRRAEFCHRYPRATYRRGANPDDPDSGCGVSSLDGRIHRFGNRETK